MLASEEKRTTWRMNGLAYAAREDLYGCHDRAVEIIEDAVFRKQFEPLHAGVGDLVV